MNDTLESKRIDRIINHVLERFDGAGDSTEDIYVWADGRVTGPPTNNEPDDNRLITVVTPGGVRPTREELWQTLETGLEVVDNSPGPDPTASVFESSEERSDDARVLTDPHYNNIGPSPPVR